MRIMKLAAGLGIGYVLGARAGREKYEQIAAFAGKLGAPNGAQPEETAVPPVPAVEVATAPSDRTATSWSDTTANAGSGVVDSGQPSTAGVVDNGQSSKVGAVDSGQQSAKPGAGKGSRRPRRNSRPAKPPTAGGSKAP